MKTVLQGDIVTMDGNFTVVKGGHVCISDTVIEHVLAKGQALPADYKDVSVVDTKGTIYPGFIELHNHLSYDTLTLWQVPQAYSARETWQSNAQYAQLVKTPVGILGKHADLLPCMTRYAEAKCLVAGVTTSQGIGLVNAAGIQKFYHGTVRNVETPKNARLPGAMTHIPDVALSDWTKFKGELDKAAQHNACMLLHLAEGTDAKARGHFLTLKNAHGDWAINGSLAGIHCTALTEPDFKELGSRGASVVWSPLSNLLLYGGTTKVDLAAKEGCLIALGSDWSPSGSKNLLCELKVAKVVCHTNGIPFKDRDLVAAVTSTAAKVMKWDKALGSIEAGKIADLTVMDGTSADPYGKLIASRETDVALVLIDGVAKYGSKALMDAMSVQGEAVTVGGTAFVASFDKDPNLAYVTLKDATADLKTALKNLPSIANGHSHAHALSALHALGVAPRSGGTTWQLADEEHDHPPFDLSPGAHAAFHAMMAATPKPVPVAVDLDPLTVADDPHFAASLQTEKNIPAAVKTALKSVKF